MSDYYNPKRKASWNYGGKQWKLSRSKIDLFMSCSRCFYIDNKLGVKRPPGYPFAINSAVDSLLKKEFDIHRAKGEQHPLQKKYKVNVRPVSHEELNTWRENFKGVRYLDEETGFLVTGAIDDLWINDKDEYVVVDYKATAKAEPVTELNQKWQDGYKRQMEIYQWLLKKKGMKVSDIGYFVYCTGKLDREAFDGKIDFDVNLIEYKGDSSWVSKKIKEIKVCLDSENIPESNPECDYCAYCKGRLEEEVK